MSPLVVLRDKNQNKLDSYGPGDQKFPIQCFKGGHCMGKTACIFRFKKKSQSSFLFCAKSWLQLIPHHMEKLNTYYYDSKSMLHSDNVYTGTWESQNPAA
jgi:hypothetical protein